MASVTFTCEVPRRNPMILPVRDVALPRGDDLTLAVRIVASDGTAQDLSGYDLFVTFAAHLGVGMAPFHDYGWGAWTMCGDALLQTAVPYDDATSGMGEVVVPREMLSCWPRRVDMAIGLNGDTIARGLVQLMPGLSTPQLGPFGQVIIDDATLT